jgi:hypothetical protein
MSIACDSSLTLIGVRVGGVSEKNRDHVEQQHEVGAGLERPRGVCRLHHRHFAGRPAVHVHHLTAVHGPESRPRVGAVERSRDARHVERQVGVVQHLRAVRTKLDGAHVPRRGNRHRKDEVAEDVARPWPDLVRFGRLQHEVGRAELPAAGGWRRCGRVGRIAFGRAALSPLRNQRDLVVAEPPFAGEHGGTWLGQPRWHGAPLHRRRDLARVAPSRVVVEHAERRPRDANRIVIGRCGARRGHVIDRAMTAGAVVEQDWRDVAAEGDRAWSRPCHRCRLVRGP